jgi:putative membrane protein
MLLDYYRHFLAFHIIGVIAWMAGILYLFRLFVYHAAETESVVKARFVVMERRLYKYITVPAMLFALVFGLLMLIANPQLFRQPWIHAKLTLVFLLMGYTGLGGRFRRKLEAGTCTVSERAFRWLNEVPTAFMIVIVFLAILKPF